VPFNSWLNIRAIRRLSTDSRRLPPPWSVEELNDACFVVRDHDGQQLAYVYFEEEAGRRSAAKLLTKDEARRIAANIAKLPGQLRPGRLKSNPIAAYDPRSMYRVSIIPPNKIANTATSA
jgi:hypothetical protein